jgi:hypothetical protein
MVAAVGRTFAIARTERVPFLYRGLCTQLELSNRGARIGAAVFDVEQRGIAAGALQALGLRIVATRS